MLNVKRVIAKFRLEVAQTPQEAATFLLEELVYGLTLTNLKKPLKISTNIIQFKDKLIKLKLEEAAEVIEKFNEIITIFFENYKEQYIRWNRPNTIDFKEILLQEINKSRKILNKGLLEVSLIAITITKDLELLELKHNYEVAIKNKIKKEKDKLKKLIKVNYTLIIETVKSEKLPLI